MNIPASELREAERKCNTLADIGEDYLHIIDNLERRYSAEVRVQIIRPVVGGGAGPKRIILVQIERIHN
jgi:hypothetical protein